MGERWAIDASPLILLAAIGYESLLRDLSDEVMIPFAVAEEVLVGPQDDSARRLLEQGRFPIADTLPPSGELLAWDLGAGETAVISQTIANPGWTAVLDDAAGRRCARALGVPHRGTLGIILLARQSGLIPSASPLLRRLRERGFRIDDRIVAQALSSLTDETWP